MNYLMKNWRFDTAYNNLYIFPDEMKVNKASYEYTMLCENNIKNTLSFQGATETNYRYYKDLHWEWLNRWLVKPVKDGVRVGNNKFNKKSIIKIIRTIDDVISEMEKYLISENSLCLNLDSIATDGENFYFALIPNNNSDFSYELSKFLIKILRYVDVEDKEGIDLAYNLFVKSSKEDYTMVDLLTECDKKENKMEV